VRQCYTLTMPEHIVQSQDWADFKNAYGTSAVTAGGVVYTKHKIPFSNSYFAYSPKVDPSVIDFEAVKTSLEVNDCININFDVPNILKGTEEEQKALIKFNEHSCELAPRDQFAKSNVILDLTKSEEELLSNLHTKHRYNMRYAIKKGVTVKTAETQDDFDVFYDLFKSTSIRQKYFVRPKIYYQKIWEMFGKKNASKILTSYYEGKPLASWMLLTHKDILYYPYGGSSEEFKNMHGSTVVGWEAILLGKKLGCHTFDMWGASENIDDTEDPWWGFTNFKLRFGGTYVKYMDSYDYVLNSSMYKMFTTANTLRWKLLRVIK